MFGSQERCPHKHSLMELALSANKYYSLDQSRWWHLQVEKVKVWQYWYGYPKVWRQHAVDVKAESDDNEVANIDVMGVVVVDFFTAKKSIDLSCLLLLLVRKLVSNLVND